MSARPIDRRTAVLLTLAAFMTGGLTGNLTAPEPKPAIRTITLAVPPACVEAIDAARSERAHTATAQEHDTLAAQASADLADAALTRDREVIEDAATALDGELRLAQQADLDRAAAAAAFDTAAGKCLPERQP